MGVSKNRGNFKSSILIGFSIINHPFWGTPIFGNIQIDVFSYIRWSFQFSPSVFPPFPAKLLDGRFFPPQFRGVIRKQDVRYFEALGGTMVQLATGKVTAISPTGKEKISEVLAHETLKIDSKTSHNPQPLEAFEGFWMSRAGSFEILFQGE